MTTVEDLVTDVYRLLRQPNGRDVQLHSQDFVVLELQKTYRLLHKKYVFRDYVVSNEFTTDSSGNLLLADATTANLTKYHDIIAVYLENESNKLPHMPASANRSIIKTPMLYATGDTTIFGVTGGVERTLTLVNKNYSKVAFELDTEVDFYDDLLSIAAALSLSATAGVNDQATQKLQTDFNNWLTEHLQDELKDYAINNSSSVGLNEWTAQ